MKYQLQCNSFIIILRKAIIPAGESGRRGIFLGQCNSFKSTVTQFLPPFLIFSFTLFLSDCLSVSVCLSVCLYLSVSPSLSLCLSFYLSIYLPLSYSLILIFKMFSNRIDRKETVTRLYNFYNQDLMVGQSILSQNLTLYTDRCKLIQFCNLILSIDVQTRKM